MVVTNYGKSGLAILMTGSTEFIPRYCAIGSGSGAEVVGLGSLIAEVLTDRKDYTDREIDVPAQVTWLFDFNSIEMSGVTLKEFGIGGSEAKGSNTLYNREGFDGITFDGTNELQVEIRFEIF